MSKLTVIPFARDRRVPRGSSGGVPGLVQWIRQAHPMAFRELARTRPQLLRQAAQLNGLGTVAQPSGGGLVQTANNIAAAVMPFLQLDAQRKLLKLQVERAKRGEPPIDTTQLTLPAARVEIEAGQAVRTGMKWGGIALGAALIGAFWLARRR